MGVLLGVAGSAGGIGAAAGLALMLPMEAGVPVPLPADVVMLGVGTRVSAGDVPLWVAVLAFEAVALIGTSTLFFVMRGPGHAVVARVGPRLGLTESRLSRAASLVEHRGRPALAVGRATPGLRTLTVVAAGGSGMSVGRVLPALVFGSSVFLQLHLFLGYFLGSAARHVLRTTTGPAIGVLAVLGLGAITFWVMRRGRHVGTAGLFEAACPACLGLAYVSEQPTEMGPVVAPNSIEERSEDVHREA